MTEEKVITICVLDDHRLVVDGILSMLSDAPHINVVAATTDPAMVPELLKAHAVQILLTDVNMPGTSGVEITRIVKKLFPEIRIICISMFGDVQAISEMVSAGVTGYILKNTGKQELIAAIEQVAAGNTYFSNEVSLEMMRAATGENKDARLTNREIEIIRFIEKEYSNKQIADELFLSERTVETHRKNIFRKTATQSIIGLIKYAYEHKIV